jgi:hypothetical protein
VTGMSKEIVYFMISIDTEEDDWGVYKPPGYHLTNIAYLPELQRFFDIYKIKPTCLIDYSVVADESHKEFFKMVYDSGQAEIEANLHPWNTPPFEEELTIHNSMMKNLSPVNIKLKKSITKMKCKIGKAGALCLHGI